MLSQRIKICLLALIVCSGCQSTFLPKHFTQTIGFRENNSARENPANQTSDPWINDVGEYTREEHGQQEVVDPLKLRNFFMSSKAQDIERNLGVGR